MPESPKATRQVTIDYEPHETQELVHRDNSRFRLIAAGRKWGKTTMCSMEAFRYLGKPEAIIWWVAPHYDLAMIGWRRFLTLIPPITIKSVNKKDREIHMVNNSMIKFKTADNPRNLLGEGLDLCVVDEAARIKEEAWFEHLRPNLDDPEHLGHALLISTPRSYNFFYDRFMDGLNSDISVWRSWHTPFKGLQGGFPSWMNPYLRLEDIRLAKKMPEKVFLQEYAARFLKDLGAVFRKINRGIDGNLEPPYEDIEYVAGVDWGRANSYTVITILNHKGHLVAYDRFQRGSWMRHVARVAETLREYKAKALCDSTGLGDPIHEMLKRQYHNIKEFKIKPSNRGDLIENLALMIDEGDITYPDIPELTEELQAFGVKQYTNRVSYQAPSGFADDFVFSLALAAWQLKKNVGDIGFEFLVA